MDAETPKPNWQEAFKGKDVVLGGEIVNNLIYENIGIPVYSRDYREKKTKILIDRQVGEEDFTVRQQEENNRKLLGIIVPTPDKDEFVYLGIEEGSFVFHSSEGKSSNFHKDTAVSFTFSWERFGDYISNGDVMRTENPTKITLREETDPARFTEVVLSAVEKERDRIQQIKEKRANVREDLIRKLFGDQS